MAAVLYIHIPYCKSKCPYCDFASVPIDASADAYLRALLKEARNFSEAISSAETLYIGGGTPTILTAEQICGLFTGLKEIFRFSPYAEITVEANPCSLDSQKAQAFSSNGVNRASLGVQSFIEAELRQLGRRHTAGEAAGGFHLLRDAGISNISLDLIYGIPNQSISSWRYSLERAIELKPEHISAYCLTFEQNTPLWRLMHERKIQKKSEEEELEFYETARSILSRAGYEHYEISNFALPGKRSAHNMVYWSNEEYLGLGAGAVSYLGNMRIANLPNPADYIRAIETNGNAACETDKITPQLETIETIIQRLRLSDGVNRGAFAERFGLYPEDIMGGSLPELIQLDLLEKTADTIRASLKGWHLANEVALKILP